jgi:16S rRNA (cytidine1402-2'-O)-methyltransferase
VPVLYVVATPIGNLEDISLRALQTLGQVKLIAAEDTRTTRHLLDKYNIKTSVTSYYEHNKLKKLDYIMKVLQDGDVALVSDAGMPGISDTGHELISAAINNNIRVITVPGASAVLTALIASGLPADQFSYVGFLPRSQKARQQFLKSIAGEQRTIVAFETPHRLLKALADIKLVLGDRNIAVCRELTKKYEEVFRGRVSLCIDHFNAPRGEFTIVIEGFKPGERHIDETVRKMMVELYRPGMTARKAVDIVSAKSGVSRKELYSLWISLKKEKDYA